MVKQLNPYHVGQWFHLPVQNRGVKSLQVDYDSRGRVTAVRVVWADNHVRGYRPHRVFDALGQTIEARGARLDLAGPLFSLLWNRLR